MQPTDDDAEFTARMKVFLANRHQFPPEELLRYSGEWIAWHPEGTAVIAHTKEPLELFDLIRAAGYNPAHCVNSYIEE